ncbi:MAG: potassium/proton antiporter [Gemmatimonadales bacterium]
MDHAAHLMLVTGALLFAGVLSSRLSARSGVPGTILFVSVGLLAGSEGLFRIAFDDPALASALATGCLALILFDGGLGTRVRDIRRVAGPAVLLATLGVVVSAALVGAVAVLLLRISWLEGLLLGSILGSTDAAAVFAAFRGRPEQLPARLRSTLEVESGLNDPIAIFLTVALTAVLAGGAAPPWWAVGTEFVREMGVGIVLGGAVGWFSGRLMRRLHLDVAGLYLVFSLAVALLAFGGAHIAHGSGYIAVYLAGVLMGETRLPFERGVRRFHDGVAWICQVGVFVLLGLLAFPSRLVAAAPEGLTLAVVLVVLARPVSVWLTTLFFRFDWRDRLVLSCGGLRGAVPVILATIPLAAGLEGAGEIFNITFFAVIVSVLIQGTLLVPLARRLKRVETGAAEPSVSLELTALRETGQELLGYRVEPRSTAAGKPVRDLALPADALVVLVVRDKDVIPPRGSTALREHDLVYVLSGVANRPVIAELFAQGVPDEAMLAGPPHEFALDARITTVGDLDEFYGIALGAPREELLSAWLADRLKRRAQPGDRIHAGESPAVLVVLSVRDRKPHMVGVDLEDRTED